MSKVKPHCQTSEKTKDRNANRKIYHLTLTENVVFMLDSVAYSKKQMEKIDFQWLKIDCYKVWCHQSVYYSVKCNI